MSYENTEVPVSRSQEGIRKLIMSRKGGKVAFISDPPSEGFHAEVLIEGLPYQIRVMGQCRPAPESKPRMYRGRKLYEKETTDKARELFRQTEERRIWRVIFYHLKSVFEAADSGVMEFRELMLPENYCRKYHSPTRIGHSGKFDTTIRVREIGGFEWKHPR